MNTSKKFSFEGKKSNILIHVTAWLIMFILPLYLLNFKVDINSAYYITSFYLRTSIYVFIFYINYLWLVPKLLLNNKLKTYIAALLITLSISMIANSNGQNYLLTRAREVIEQSIVEYRAEHPETQEGQERPEQQQDGRGRPQRQDHQERPNRGPGMYGKFHIYDFLVTSMFVTSLSIGILLSRKYIRNEKEKKELEKARLDSELALLKNQIGPHFFFNTLNNIYSLVSINTDDAQKAIMNLSKLMRYLLYETQQEKIQLRREIDFMRNYIDLMKLRLTKNVDLKISFPENEPEIMLPPLLFIPFIENAFKHGVSNKEKSFIDISLTKINKNINFTCINSSVNNNRVYLSNDHGIGLDNIKKRLNLLFPQKHTLEINKTDTEFKVLLTINCQE